MMHINDVVALGYRYPTPTALEGLRSALAQAEGRRDAIKEIERFVDGVATLDLGAWEELHTATVDLSAPFVAYVGHVIWGDNYRRGEFMADLQVEMRNAGIDLNGELPDHIEPVLRYLARTDEPLADLLEVLPRAVAEMDRKLRSTQPTNPYCHLLAATVLCAGNHPVVIGGRR